MNNRDNIDRASEHLDRAADHSADAARHTTEALEAGASGVLERTRDTLREAGHRVGDAAREAGRTAGRVAERVSHAEADVELERRVDNVTENVVEKAGGALRGAAPVVGRAAELAVGAVGSALSTISGPLGVIVGKIAGRVGGWWNTASEAIAELPEEERQACRVHFEAYELRPADLTFDTALPGYALGYVAARNPSYRGRGFDEIEPDLRHGFGTEPNHDYDSLRDFTRFGYERGSLGASGRTEL